MMRSSPPEPHDRVVLAVGLIPPGRVASYGDIASIVGIGPRQVGAILRRTQADVPWWRVLGHDGVLALVERARPHWDAEGIAVRPDGRGCRISLYRVDLSEVATEYHLAAAQRGWPPPDS